MCQREAHRYSGQHESQNLQGYGHGKPLCCANGLPATRFHRIGRQQAMWLAVHCHFTGCRPAPYRKRISASGRGRRLQAHSTIARMTRAPWAAVATASRSISPMPCAAGAKPNRSDLMQSVTAKPTTCLPPAQGTAAGTDDLRAAHGPTVRHGAALSALKASTHSAKSPRTTAGAEAAKIVARDSKKSPRRRMPLLSRSHTSDPRPFRYRLPATLIAQQFTLFVAIAT